MSAARRAVGLRILALVGAVALSFVAFQEPVRHIEAVVSARIAEWATGAAVFVLDAVIVVRPDGQPLFYAVLTPSCSALAAAASLGLLGSIAPRTTTGQKVVAAGAAIAVIVVGNFVRLSGSLVAGAVGGRAALVAFHDGLGSILTFAYILGGYVLMLWLLLPAERTPLAVPHVRG